MIEKVRKISNPLTIIAIFAALAEVAGTAALVGVSDKVQLIFVWFVMLFPAVLVLLFFMTLNFNHHVLYAPSDYESDSNFLEAIQGRKKLNLNLQSIEDEVNNLSDTLKETLENNSGVNGEELQNYLSQEFGKIREKVEVTKESANELSLQALPRSELQAKILGFIYSQKRPVSLTELSENLNMSEPALERAASKMVKRGTIDAVEYDGVDCYLNPTFNK